MYLRRNLVVGRYRGTDYGFPEDGDGENTIAPWCTSDGTSEPVFHGAVNAGIEVEEIRREGELLTVRVSQEDVQDSEGAYVRTWSAGYELRIHESWAAISDLRHSHHAD